jgi:hypothetical protein
MRVAPGIIVASCAGVLAGCGTSNADQVKAKVDQFVTAAASRKYTTICQDVLAPSLVARLEEAGVTCPQAMQIAFGTVKDPTISIGKVTVSGSRASVLTLSAAKNQDASLEAIDLIKTSKGWRLASLASPLTTTEARHSG